MWRTRRFGTDSSKWGPESGKKIVKKKRRHCLVVDETKVRTKSGWIYVFGAVDPENREIVYLLATRYQEGVDALGFLKRCLLCYKGGQLSSPTVGLGTTGPPGGSG
ncbi:MAG: hypothetical protein ACUVQM_04815 [Candidatus Hadarchaeaceae archaeon]